MEKVSCKKDADNLKQNKVIGSFPELDNSTIRFKGKNNIVFCEEHVCIRNSNLNFNGDNALIYLSKSNRWYNIHAVIHNNSVCHIGKNNSFSDKLTMVLSEQKHIFIGDDNMFSRGIWIRVADPHLIYNAETYERCNQSKSVFIGDHIWIAQDAMLLKGSKISSGSIIGAMALVSGKNIPSNVSCGGNPCRIISKDVFWDRTCVHEFTDSDTEEYNTMKKDNFIFENVPEQYMDFDFLDKKFSEKVSAEKKLEFIKNELLHNKNRFGVK